MTYRSFYLNIAVPTLVCLAILAGYFFSNTTSIVAAYGTNVQDCTDLDFIRFTKCSNFDSNGRMYAKMDLTRYNRSLYNHFVLWNNRNPRYEASFTMDLRTKIRVKYHDDRMHELENMARILDKPIDNGYIVLKNEVVELTFTCTAGSDHCRTEGYTPFYYNQVEFDTYEITSEVDDFIPNKMGSTQLQNTIYYYNETFAYIEICQNYIFLFVCLCTLGWFVYWRSVYYTRIIKLKQPNKLVFEQELMFALLVVSIVFNNPFYILKFWVTNVVEVIFIYFQNMGYLAMLLFIALYMRNFSNALEEGYYKAREWADYKWELLVLAVAFVLVLITQGLLYQFQFENGLAVNTQQSKDYMRLVVPALVLFGILGFVYMSYVMYYAVRCAQKWSQMPLVNKYLLVLNLMQAWCMCVRVILSLTDINGKYLLVELEFEYVAFNIYLVSMANLFTPKYVNPKSKYYNNLNDNFIIMNDTDEQRDDRHKYLETLNVKIEQETLKKREQELKEQQQQREQLEKNKKLEAIENKYKNKTNGNANTNATSGDDYQFNDNTKNE